MKKRHGLFALLAVLMSVVMLMSVSFAAFGEEGELENQVPPTQEGIQEEQTEEPVAEEPVEQPVEEEQDEQLPDNDTRDDQTSQLQQQQQQQQEYPHFFELLILKRDEFGFGLPGVQFRISVKRYYPHTGKTDEEFTEFRTETTCGQGAIQVFEYTDGVDKGWWSEILIEETVGPAGFVIGEPKVIKTGVESLVQEQHVDGQQPAPYWHKEETITNSRARQNFLIFKTDQNGTPLPGAEFEIYGRGTVITGPQELCPPKWK